MAQGADALNNQARMGGVMQAAALSCGGYTDAQLRDLKAQQQKALAENGMSGAAFEAAFAAGEAQGKQAISQASAEQKKQMCDELKSAGVR
ncbi:Uncharacterised protein [Bordetella trematum]|nr:lipoprotein [Bordetella trematum]VDH05464.1 Uncharacterised protein [Bordetella trematum]